MRSQVKINKLSLRMQKTYNKTQLQVKEACVNKKTLKTFKYLNDVRRCSSIVKKMSLTSDCVYK